MNLVCCIKQVPDTADVKIDPETNTLIRSGVESITNPYDLVAVQAAVDVKESYGGKVTVITHGAAPGGSSAEGGALRRRGQGRPALRPGLRGRRYPRHELYPIAGNRASLGGTAPVDLVICGKQAIDGDTAQVGPGIATRLGFTQLTYVTEVVAIDAAGGRITVRRKAQGGSEVIAGRLPALLTVELEMVKVRRASLPRLIGALRAPVEVWDAASLQAEAGRLGLKGSPTWVRRIFSPPAKKGGPSFDARADAGQAVEACVAALLEDAAFAGKLLTRWES